MVQIVLLAPYTCVQIASAFKKLLCVPFSVFTCNEASCSFQDIIKKLDINLSDMVGNFSETAQGIYPFSPGLSLRALSHFQ